MSEAIALRRAGCAAEVEVSPRGPTALVVITPCCRPELLRSVRDSIRFSIVTRWIIVFDADEVPREDLPTTLLDDSQITLVAIRACDSKYGNAQRHFGLQIVRAMYLDDDPLVYFLDDDNIIHPKFYDLFHRFMWRRGVFYTFNQRRAWLTCYGRCCTRAMMDTAMICLPLSLCPDWTPSSVYSEDFYFIRSVMRRHRDRHVYLNQVAAHYNALQSRAVTRLVGSEQRNYIVIASVVVVIALAVAVRWLLSLS